MKYLKLKPDSSFRSTVKGLKSGKVYSSRELVGLINASQLFSFATTANFTSSALCRKNFDVYKIDKDARKPMESDADGYSKHGRHIPSNISELDILSLSGSYDVRRLLKKMKATNACLVVNSKGKLPATINLTIM